MKRIRTILHPTDFSAGSDAAFRYACELARDYDALLVVVYVLEPVVPMVGEGGLVPNEMAELRDRGARLLSGMAPSIPGIRMQTVLQEGPATATIISTARDQSADLIVMGTHGRTGIGRLVLGSVAEEVVRKSPCPVLTVKADDASKGG